MDKLWGSRFEKDITAAVLDYTQTTDIDERLILSDIWGSIAHVVMLGRQEILIPAEGRALLKCLLGLYEEAGNGTLELNRELEDVHLNLEQQVIARLGLQVGGKIHTARSRNDQVVTDTRLYLREKILHLQAELVHFIEILIHRSGANMGKVMVGYTHGQPAQPVSVAFWLTSYASMLIRDFDRLTHAFTGTNKNPLGSCALAGTSFPIDRPLTARLLGFDGLLLHALDATSSRDFILETVSALSILMSNISRMAEEIVLFSSYEYNLVEVDDAYSTGSSIMPQKKNPVVVELARARCGRVFGSLIHVLTMVKGVPMGYNVDLQEDKPPLWRALDDTLSTVSIMREQMSRLTFNYQRALDLCRANFTTATELANHLVKEKGFSFRQAYQVTGTVVKELIKANKTLADLSAVGSELRKLQVEMDIEQLKDVIEPFQVMDQQVSQGGTSRKSVKEILEVLQGELEKRGDELKQRRQSLEQALTNTLQAARQFCDPESAG
jgi:argininosuccinate lyase